MSANQFPSDDQELSCNVDAVEHETTGRFSQQKELTEYLIQFMHEDLIDTITTSNIKIDLNEHPFIKKILLESPDEFRDLLRDAVTEGTILLNFDRNDSLSISIQKKILRNKITIEIIANPNININQLTASDFEGMVVAFEAKLSNWSKISTITHLAEYKCPECGDIIVKEFAPKIKDRCPQCKETYEFFKPRLTEDTRRITLRENINDYSNGKLPASISADIYGKTVWEVELSDKVVVLGIFRSVPLAKRDGKISQEFIPTIQIIGARSVGNIKAEQPDMMLMKKFKDLEDEGKLIDAIIDGFAYNVYKKRMEKKAVICSLIGSVWIGEVGKGNPPMIHILFVGDPDTYKSTIMKYIINVSDNCVLADSTTVSSAGVKAIAVKMDDGRWSIMAGLLPSHTGGNVFFDEFGDLKPEIHEDLKAPMVDGKVSKYVAGEEFNGVAETGVLASMNPIEGVYDEHKTIYENLAPLKKPLITRFDAIFKFSKLSADYDSAGIREHFKRCDLYGKPEGCLTDHEIKLFINYVKTINPEITEEALDRSTEYFTELESKGGEKGGTETRTENAVMKFAVALARWHMSTRVLAIHVDEAIKILESSHHTLDLDLANGEMISERSLKKTNDGRREAIRLAYDALKDKQGYAFADEVVETAMKYKCFTSENHVKALLNTLRMESKLSEKDNMIKIDWK